MDMFRLAATLLLCACIVQPKHAEAQLIKNIEKFFNSFPTFYSNSNQPSFNETGQCVSWTQCMRRTDRDYAC
jgi:hypothetical protein